jgi:hypothetical protein
MIRTPKRVWKLTEVEVRPPPPLATSRGVTQCRFLCEARVLLRLCADWRCPRMGDFGWQRRRHCAAARALGESGLSFGRKNVVD